MINDLLKIAFESDMLQTKMTIFLKKLKHKMVDVNARCLAMLPIEENPTKLRCHLSL